VSPKFLPLISQIGTRHGSRSYRTCELKCANQCDHPEPNTSGNEHIQTVMRSAFSRRNVLKVGAAGVAAAGVASLAANLPAAADQPVASGSGNGAFPGFDQHGALTHGVVPPNRKDDIVIPVGYQQAVIIGWGDPVEAGAPTFDAYKQTPEAQAKQFGYNNDYTMIVPLRDEQKALLVCNHEYTDENLMFPTGKYDAATIARIGQAAHGLTVVQIERVGRSGQWRRDKDGSRYNRRITVNTKFEVTGPAASDARVGKVAYGTFGNCAGGVTPWGTILSGEENFNGYFDVTGTVPAEYVDSYKRYGVPTTVTKSARQWSIVDARFDLTRTPTEVFKSGWVIEVDPYDPKAAPKKRTMLGRLKHEGATTTITADGRIAVYLGDDEKGEYIYKFVSAGKYDAENRKNNFGLLDEGTLYVARFTGDGTADGLYDGVGQWIPLTSDKQSFVSGFSVAEVLINTRSAADKVGATRMDRPEDVERNPVNGRIYAALTNNDKRGGTFPVDEANPLATSHVRATLDSPLVEKTGNRNGYILEISEEGDDAAKTGFNWSLFLVCGDPAAQETYFGGFDKTKVSPISCPDNVTFDGSGNLWISTDGNVLGSNDGIFTVPVAGPNRGQVKQFLSVPFGSEACGPLVSEDDKTAFVAVQHPGETDDATFEKPTSTWPHTDTFPRPAIACVWRKDGARVGS
jgi:secreted PhoX family phosphatase